MATYKYVSPSGVIVPDTSQILSDTESEWKSLFGDDLDVTPDTPQGMLIASDVAVRAEVAANNAVIANQINPNYAGGIFLDDIWALTGGRRRAATYTLVDSVLLTGTPGVVIPSGSRRAANGKLFELLSTVVLDNAGKGTGIFQALEPGAVPCPAHTLTTPVVGFTPPGWETSDNPLAGLIGSEAQSDFSARKERRQTLAVQGRSVAEAIFSNVKALSGVYSLSLRENTSPATVVVDGISLVGHSVWACVDGGSDEAVAAALYRSKTGGAGWNGAVSVTVIDNWSGQKSVVQFDRPVARPVMAKFTVSAKGAGTGDIVSLVKETILNYANGQLANGEEGFVLGADVSPFELSAAANTASPALFIRSVEVALKSATPGWSKEDIAIGLNEKATIQADDIIVVIT